MADIRLGQTASGKWKVSLSNNDVNVPAGVVIPVTLMYQNNNPVTLNVQKNSTAGPIVTEWYTPLGDEIDTSLISFNGERTVGDKTYRVVNIRWTVVPAGGGGTRTLTVTGSFNQIDNA